MLTRPRRSRLSAKKCRRVLPYPWFFAKLLLAFAVPIAPPIHKQPKTVFARPALRQ
ncbi:MAG: hypothetical protein HC890_18685 [Chloroflexaceae bacterium]|nr:hypothetical protein [Chloroflexaceae bacterium]